MRLSTQVGMCVCSLMFFMVTHEGYISPTGSMAITAFH
jgi:hypothetical protein